MIAERRPFFIAGGNLDPNAACYVEREADRELFEALLRGEFCYVLDARQVGKSSLRVRTAARLQAAGLAVAQIDLTSLGTTSNTIEQWYYGLLRRIGGQLRLLDALEQFWIAHERLGPLQCWVAAIQEILLPRHGQLVLFIDEIDNLRQVPFLKDEFLAAIRSCHDRRTVEPEFARLTFCLLGTATPADLIQDPRATPFNIGRRIELTDFTEAEAVSLTAGFVDGKDFNTRSLRSLETQRPQSAQRKPFEEEAEVLLRRVLYWTGGHPYLTQRLCRAIAEARTGIPSPSPSPSAFSVPSVPSVSLAKRVLSLSPPDTRAIDALCEEEFLSRERRDVDHLEIVSRRLLESEGDRAAMLSLYADVRRAGVPQVSGRRSSIVGRMGLRWLIRRSFQGSAVLDDDTHPLAGRLRLSGLARPVDGELRVRNRIYERVFDAAWIADNMPDAEVRRQRAAERRGRLQAYTRVGIVALLCAGWAVTALLETRATKRILGSSYLAQARALRRSGRPGQRVESLALIEKAARMGPSLELRNEAIACMALTDIQVEAEWTENPPESAIGIPDGRFERYVVGGPNGEISLRRTRSDPELMRLPGAGPRLLTGTASPDYRFLAVRDVTDHLFVWDLETRRRLIHGLGGKWAEAVAFTPDGRWLAATTRTSRRCSIPCRTERRADACRWEWSHAHLGSAPMASGWRSAVSRAMSRSGTWRAASGNGPSATRTRYPIRSGTPMGTGWWPRATTTPYTSTTSTPGR